MTQVGKGRGDRVWEGAGVTEVDKDRDDGVWGWVGVIKVGF